MAGLGHEGRLPPRLPSGCCPWNQPTFAAEARQHRQAPIPDSSLEMGDRAAGFMPIRCWLLAAPISETGDSLPDSDESWAAHAGLGSRQIAS
jgi:hypothetical protein